MIFVTGADRRFEAIVREWMRCLDMQGYQHRVYDLGNLGFGIKGFEEHDPTFVANGFYNTIGGKWCSTGLWKPRVVDDALAKCSDDLVYLDADAHVRKPVVVNWDEFTIGVAEREWINSNKNPNNCKCAIKTMLRGDYNAGVIFFRNEGVTKNFVQDWSAESNKLGNDQLALSHCLNAGKVKLKVFPSAYNSLSPGAIIQHVTGRKKHGQAVR